MSAPSIGADAPGGLPTRRELDALFAVLRGASGVVLAVSGGPDSVALLHLVARWRPPGLPLTVATVDHGLRAESGAEATLVAQLSNALDLPHHTLPWTGAKPAHGLQEAARDARYALLDDLARTCGASHLVTAHTLDDQAETVLMRLSRGSGLAGLAGMRPVVERKGLLHVRPLLTWPKARLVALCRREGWPFVEDPSNRDERYARTRWRRLMPELAAEGLTAERLAGLSERARRAEDALDAKAREALSRARLGGTGGLRLAARPFVEEPFEIALRAFALALAENADDRQRLRLDRVETCLEALREAAGAGRTLRRTIAGRLVSLDRRGEIAVAAEPPRRRGRYPRASARQPET